MKKTKFAEEKSKGSKALSVVIIVLLVFLAIFAVSFGESHLSSKSDKQVSVGQLDASSEPMVKQTKLYREYNGDGFILSLTEQGDYVLVGNDATYQFTGKYVVKRGQEAIQAVGEDTVKKAGLNPKKINTDNLYAVSCNYNEHYFKGGTEYYNGKIQNADDSAFYFLIYFKQSQNQDFVSAVHYLGDIATVKFENSFF